MSTKNKSSSVSSRSKRLYEEPKIENKANALSVTMTRDSRKKTKGEVLEKNNAKQAIRDKALDDFPDIVVPQQGKTQTPQRRRSSFAVGRTRKSFGTSSTVSSEIDNVGLDEKSSHYSLRSKLSQCTSQNVRFVTLTRESLKIGLEKILEESDPEDKLFENFKGTLEEFLQNFCDSLAKSKSLNDLSKEPVLQPNPKNIELQANIEAYEKALQCLQSEEKEWETLMQLDIMHSDDAIDKENDVSTNGEISDTTAATKIEIEEAKINLELQISKFRQTVRAIQYIQQKGEVTCNKVARRLAERTFAGVTDLSNPKQLLKSI